MIDSTSDANDDHLSRNVMCTQNDEDEIIDINNATRTVSQAESRLITQRRRNSSSAGDECLEISHIEDAYAPNESSDNDETCSSDDFNDSINNNSNPSQYPIDSVVDVDIEPICVTIDEVNVVDDELSVAKNNISNLNAHLITSSNAITADESDDGDVKCTSFTQTTTPTAHINNRITTNVKPVLRKHNRLISFFRSFITTRRSRRKLKRRSTVKEKVFGYDLGDHVLATNRDIPLVLKVCSEFIETNGVAHGIYRLSGISSNIQKLRRAFDEDRSPDFSDKAILQDIHCVASLLKQYFRELPNPLLTFQLYEKFVRAVHVPEASDDEGESSESREDLTESMKLARIYEVIRLLPPPHYRTLEYLTKHLARVAAHHSITGMNCKNLAIVWAPNLLRSKELETQGGIGALHLIGVQAVLTEYLIRYSDILFRNDLDKDSLLFNTDLYNM